MQIVSINSAFNLKSIVTDENIYRFRHNLNACECCRVLFKCLLVISFSTTVASSSAQAETCEIFFFYIFLKPEIQ